MKARGESLLRLALTGGWAKRGGAARTLAQAVAPLPAPSGAPQANAFNCGLISERAEPVSSVALADRIDPANAPYPTNESERLLFRQLYETLVRVDCDGHVAPGL